MSRYLILKKDDDEDEYPWVMNEAIGEFGEDPFRAIREFYKSWKPIVGRYTGNDLKLSGFPFIEGFIGLWTAISETIKIVGEGEK
jgi:hypothetical protein